MNTDELRAAVEASAHPAINNAGGWFGRIARLLAGEVHDAAE